MTRSYMIIVLHCAISTCTYIYVYVRQHIMTHALTPQDFMIYQAKRKMYISGQQTTFIYLQVHVCNAWPHLITLPGLIMIMTRFHGPPM